MTINSRELKSLVESLRLQAQLPVGSYSNVNSYEQGILFLETKANSTLVNYVQGMPGLIMLKAMAGCGMVGLSWAVVNYIGRPGTAMGLAGWNGWAVVNCVGRPGTAMASRLGRAVVNCVGRPGTAMASWNGWLAVVNCVGRPGTAMAGINYVQGMALGLLKSTNMLFFITYVRNGFSSNCRANRLMQ